MRAFAFAVVLIILIAGVFQNAQGQGGLGQGVYEFESTGANSASGPWAVNTANGAAGLFVNVAASIEYNVIGNGIVIQRFVQTTNGHTMNVCVDTTTCKVIQNGSTSYTSRFWMASIISFPSDGAHTVTITWVSGTLLLDYFMILGDASSAFPTAAPTATILPSSTPASTTTPQPTPTPQPTSTPLQYVWALDPSRRYGDTNGQISAVEYSASAADIHNGNLLTMLLMSVWGIFTFCLVMWWHKKWWR